MDSIAWHWRWGTSVLLAHVYHYRCCRGDQHSVNDTLIHTRDLCIHDSEALLVIHLLPSEPWQGELVTPQARAQLVWCGVLCGSGGRYGARMRSFRGLTSKSRWRGKELLRSAPLANKGGGLTPWRNPGTGLGEIDVDLLYTNNCRSTISRIRLFYALFLFVAFGKQRL